MRYLVALLLCAGLVTACGDERSLPAKPINADSGVRIYRLPSGRTVTCVLSNGSYGNSGISCDWTGAR